jgi:hypothetical protein
MASKHRKQGRAGKKIATMGAATATVTAMTMTTAPPPPANAEPPVESLAAGGLNPALVGGYATAVLGGLTGGSLAAGPDAAAVPAALAATPGSPGLPPMELAPGAPDPAAIPDLTFGIGTQAYDGFQAVGAALERFILDNFNLSGLLQALGYDPEEAINNALGSVITGLLAGIPLDLGSLLGGLGLPPAVTSALTTILNAAGITNVLALTQLIGLDLGDPLNLAGVDAPGLNIITAGPPFSVLKFLGVDLGWVPGYPNSVADEINNTPYLDISALGILDPLVAQFPVPPLSNIPVATALGLLTGIVSALPGGDLDIVDLRIPVVAGFGLGAFAAGMAYPQVVEQLANQPGGANYTGSSPLLGSITVLPLVLLRNPGRANGGLFARLYPLAALAGINTVTPDTEASSSTNPDNVLNIPVLGTGITLGGANLIPVKVDATVQYDPLSDFPAWFNPVSLLNAGAAGMFPTYILRGLTLAGVLEALTDQATPQLNEAIAAALARDPLALNLYLTLPTDALPLLEPIRLPVDFLNLVTGANFNNPIATALEPALKILTNLGFTDVDQENGYVRTLDQAGVITPFGTLPDVDWARVPKDVFQALIAGIGQAWQEGIISSTPVDNPLRTLVNIVESLLGGGSGQIALTDVPEAGALAAPAGDSAPPAGDPEGTDEPEEVPGEVEDATEATEGAALGAHEQVNTAFRDALQSLDDIVAKSRNDIEWLVRGTNGDDDESAAGSDDSEPDPDLGYSDKSDQSKADTADADKADTDKADTEKADTDKADTDKADKSDSSPSED